MFYAFEFFKSRSWNIKIFLIILVWTAAAGTFIYDDFYVQSLILASFMLCLSYFILDKAKSTPDYEKKSLIDSKHSNHTDAEERALVQFKELMKGRNQFSTLKAPDSPPSWLDKEACKKGRDFFLKNASSLTLSWMEAQWLGLYCIPNFYKVIKSHSKTGKNDSRKRYMDRGALLYSWYKDDCWENDSLASKEIRKVNNLHRFIANKTRPIYNTWSDDDSKIELEEQDKILLNDIAVLRNKTKLPDEYFDYVNDSCAFSQVDMYLVQVSFFNYYLQYPEHFGEKTSISYNDEEVQNFLMFWRTNGYYLGIDDEYNAVLDDMDETRIMAELGMEKIIKPSLLTLAPESIQMAKAALLPFMDYHVTMYSIFELLGFDLQNLWKSFNIVQKFKYYLRHVYVHYIYPLPLIKTIINKIFVKTMEENLDAYKNRFIKHARPHRKSSKLLKQNSSSKLLKQKSSKRWLRRNSSRKLL